MAQVVHLLVNDQKACPTVGHNFLRGNHFMRNFTKLALALTLALPGIASAQAPNLGEIKFRGDAGANGTISGVNVGPYKGDLRYFNDAPSPLFADINNTIIWCVDWSHVAPSTTTWDTYWGTAVAGTDFSKTRARTNPLDATNAAAKLRYEKAAWLIEQYNAGVADYTAVNVQGSIWKLMGGTPNTVAFNSQFINLLGGGYSAPGALTRNWFVLSDDATSGSGSNQEFLYSTGTGGTTSVVPEPSTYLLMATGLVALGLVSRRRRQQQQS